MRYRVVVSDADSGAVVEDIETEGYALAFEVAGEVKTVGSVGQALVLRWLQPLLPSVGKDLLSRMPFGRRG